MKHWHLFLLGIGAYMAAKVAKNAAKTYLGVSF